MRKIGFNDGWHCRTLPGGDKFDVTLPHDWSIGQARRADAPSGSAGGYFVTSDLEYTKEFTLPEGTKHAMIYFDGAYRDAEVYVDGMLRAREPHPYAPFQAEVSPKTGTHSVRVTLAASAEPSSRWYAGCGIYRQAFLYVSGETAIDPLATRINGEWEDGSAVLELKAHCVWDVADTDTLEINVGGLSFSLPASRAGEGVRLPCPGLKSWTADEPCLYEVSLKLMRGGVCLDEHRAETGFITVKLDRERGLLVNGKPVKLKGGCVHHDHGILGAAAYPEAEERKARLLKENGFNAVRCAHNMPSAAFLEACDRVGLYVLDEFTDMWGTGKNLHDYHRYFDDWWRRDLLAMLLQGRNHPSVIMWSIGNEIPERDGSNSGYSTASCMAEFVRRFDARPVTSGLNNIGAWKAEMLDANLVKDGDEDYFDRFATPFLDKLDVAGYNYMFSRYAKDLKAHPERFIVGTESVTHEAYETWQATQSDPRVTGDFCWSAIDYLGEAGIGHIRETEGGGYFEGYPFKTANCGDIDIIGNKTPASYYRDAVWGRLEKPYIVVQPPRRYASDGFVSYWGFPERYNAWDWPDSEGQPIRVEVYTCTEKVSLYLNDELVGSERAEGRKAVFETVYRPGTLTAQDDTGAQSSVSTPGASAKLEVRPDRETFNREGQLAFVEIALTDEKGVLRAFDRRQLKVDVVGGRLIALGSADRKSEENFFDESCRLYEGRALAAVLCGGKDAEVTVSCPGAEEVRTLIPFKAQ
ncbi:MAG: DUF4982 domain-containing protein [Clostridiales bacterium]|nr:DUF4982 domain-containing protein [Clostridiales bacterium]